MADPGQEPHILTARKAGLVSCLHCGRVWPENQLRCGRCGARMNRRYRHSLQRVWAWWIAGLVAYVPANLYPMLITDQLGSKMGSTILGGVVELTHHGAYFVAGVVFVASIIVPTAKFFAIAYLALSVQFGWTDRPHRLLMTYEVVEFIGRWSMIDVFVVAILSALVHLGLVLEMYPGIAAICFACTVIFTMFSALSLDPRLIYDALEDTPA